MHTAYIHAHIHTYIHSSQSQAGHSAHRNTHVYIQNTYIHTHIHTYIVRKAKRAILLTGTPALSRPSELYTQISSLQPKQFPVWQEFAMRYCDGKMGRWATAYIHICNMYMYIRVYIHANTLLATQAISSVAGICDEVL